MEVPAFVNGFEVLEYGYLPVPLMPKGYVPPPDGKPSLTPAQNVAICRDRRCEGYYTLFCTPQWTYVTYAWNKTMEHAKRAVVTEYGQDVMEWNRSEG